MSEEKESYGLQADEKLRELDVAVAEKVMGWHESSVDGDWLGNEGTLTGYTCGSYYSQLPTWSPSTIIAQAMEVADKLLAANAEWNFQLGKHRDSSEPEKWYAGFNWIDELGVFRDHEYYADNPAEAICRAALAAVKDYYDQ